MPMTAWECMRVVLIALSFLDGLLIGAQFVRFRQVMDWTQAASSAAVSVVLLALGYATVRAALADIPIDDRIWPLVAAEFVLLVTVVASWRTSIFKRHPAPAD